MSKTENINLIKCHDHSFSPWHIICVHLMTGQSTEWEKIDLREDDGRDIDFDFLCPDCAVVHKEDNHQPSIDNLRAICMHCVRELRRRYDNTFEEFDELA